MSLISLDTPRRDPVKPGSETVYFHRLELMDILHIYGRRVAAGEWRDYAIRFSPRAATFAIYRRTSENSLYQIIKEPALAKKQGQWRIMGSNSQIHRRGHDLKQLLKFFDRQTLITQMHRPKSR